MAEQKQIEPWTDWRPKIFVSQWVIVVLYGLLLILFVTLLVNA